MKKNQTKLVKRGSSISLCLSLLLAMLLTALLPACSEAVPASVVSLPGAEQSLVIYTSHLEDVYGPIIKEFRERTGVWTTVIDGNTLDMLDTIKDESDAPVADIMFGGGAESHNAYANYLQSYRSPEAENIIPLFESSEDLWTPFSALPIVFVYNTKLVTEKNAPTSWADIISPRWRKTTAFVNPNASASSFTSISTLMQLAPNGGWGEMVQLADNVEGCLLERSSEIAAAVANGSFSVGIALEEVAQRYIGTGSDIAIIYPTEGTSVVPDATSLVKNAPNMESAQLFIDFTLSRDVQQMLVNDVSRRSVRLDIKEPKGLMPMDEITIVPYNYTFSAEMREKVLAYWQE